MWQLRKFTIHKAIFGMKICKNWNKWVFNGKAQLYVKKWMPIGGSSEKVKNCDKNKAI
jgi:hypothetical protein